jgi:crossover junction endodeoxyribonuclease RusA
MITFSLPYPPSVNTIWRSMRAGPMAGRVLLSKRGREYRKAVNASVTDQNGAQATFGGRLGISIILYPPDRRKADIDNRCKAILDGLTHAGVWGDDEQIDVLIVRRDRVTSGGLAEVRIWSLDE